MNPISQLWAGVSRAREIGSWWVRARDRTQTTGNPSVELQKKNGRIPVSISRTILVVLFLLSIASLAFADEDLDPFHGTIVHYFFGFETGRDTIAVTPTVTGAHVYKASDGTVFHGDSSSVKYSISSTDSQAVAARAFSNGPSSTWTLLKNGDSDSLPSFTRYFYLRPFWNSGYGALINDEKGYSVYYDGTGPTFSISPIVGWQKVAPLGNIQISITGMGDAGSGVASGSYTIDGSTTAKQLDCDLTGTECTFSTEAQLGRYVVSVTLVDHIGNSTTHAVSIANDPSGPVVSLGQPRTSPSLMTPSGYYKSYSVGAGAQDPESGVASGAYSMTSTTSSGSNTVTIVAPVVAFTTTGSYTFSYSATNGAGDSATIQGTPVFIDATVPSVTSAPIGAGYNNYYKSYGVTAQASANSKIQEFQFRRNSIDPWTDMPSSGHILFDVDGSYSYQLLAKSQVGLVTLTDAVPIHIDNSGPLVTVTEPSATTAGHYNSAKVSLIVVGNDQSGSGWDPDQTVVSINGAPEVPVLSPPSSQTRVVTLGSTEGTYTYRFGLADNLGNWTNFPAQDLDPRKIVIDRTPPVVDAFTASRTDSLSAITTVSGTPYDTVDLSFTASDSLAGLKSYDIWSVTGQAVAAPTGVPSGARHGDLTVSGSIVNGVVSVSGFNSMPSLYDMSANDGDGIRTVYICVQDKAGNPQYASISFLVKKTKPLPPVLVTTNKGVGTSSNPSVWSTAGLSLTWTSVSDATGYQVNWQDGTASGMTYVATPEFFLGGSTLASLAGNSLLTVSIFSVDAAGNFSASPTVISLHTPVKLGTLATTSQGYSAALGNSVNFAYSDGSLGTIHLIHEQAVSGGALDLIGGLFQDSHLGAHSTNLYHLEGVNDEGYIVSGGQFSYVVPNNSPGAPSVVAPALGWLGPQKPLIWSAGADPDHDAQQFTVNFGLAGSILPAVATTTEGTWTPPSPSGTPPSPFSGEAYQVSIKQTDFNSAKPPVAYGEGTTSDPVSFQYDSTSPTIGGWIDGNSNTGFVNGKTASGKPVLLGVSASDTYSGVYSVAGSFTHNIDKNNSTVTTSAVDLTNTSSNLWSTTWPTTSGNYTLSVKATDKANNNSVGATLTFDYDASAPTFENVAFEAAGHKVSGRSVYFTGGSVSDDYSGVAKIEAQWSNATVTGEWQRFSGTGMSLKLTGQGIAVNVADGVYQLNLRVTDQAGNVVTHAIPGDFVIDISSLKILLSVTGGLNSTMGTVVTDLNNLTVVADSSDPVSAVVKTEFALAPEGNDAAPWSSSWIAARDLAKTSLVAGNWYEVQAKATNGVGGTLVTRSQRLLFDNTAPEGVTLSSNFEQSYASDTVRFTGSATNTKSGIARFELTLGTVQDPTVISSQITGAVSGALIIEGTPAPLWKVLIPAGVAPGAYVATMKAVGANGITSSQSVALTVLAGVSPISVEDNGPYASGLKAWFYAPVADHFQVQIEDSSQSVIVPWKDLAAGKGEFDAGSDLTLAERGGLVDGQVYRIQVRTVSAQGDAGPTATSTGVLVDTTEAKINSGRTVLRSNAGLQSSIMDGDSLSLTWSLTPSQYSPLQSVVLLAAKGAMVHKYALPVTLEQTTAFTLSGLGSVLGLVTGDRLGLTLEVTTAAGVVTDQQMQTVFVDREAPPAPTVVRNSKFNNTHQPLTAQWVASAESSETPLDYSWAVTMNPQQLGSISQWSADTSAHAASVLSQSLGAADGQIWYFVVRAVSQTGKTSYGVSEGVTIDSTKPTVAEVYLTNSLHAGTQPTYINSLNGLSLVVDAFSEYSGVSSYSALVGVIDRDTGVFTAKGDLGTRSSSPFEIPAGSIDHLVSDASLAQGYPETEPLGLVFAVTATNQADSNSLTPGYSAGVIFDTSSPSMAALRVSVSGKQLFADWDLDKSRSAVPVTGYTLKVFQEGQSTAIATLSTRNRSASLDLSDAQVWGEGRYTALVIATNAAGTSSEAVDPLARTPFWIDHTPPSITGTGAPRFVSASMSFSATANNPASEITQWRYQVGTLQLPGLLTGGWVTVKSNAHTLATGDTTLALNHGVNVADGSVLVAQVQVQSGAGLWSDIVTTTTALVDLTPADVSDVTAPRYTTLNNVVAPVGFVLTDDQSGISGYRFGLRDTQNNLVANTWTTVTGLPGDHRVPVSAATMSYPADVSAALLHGQSYRMVVQALNLASDQWGADAGAGNVTTADLSAPVVTVDNPRLDGRVEMLTASGPPVTEFVVNSLPVDLVFHVTEDVSPTVTSLVQILDPQGNQTSTTKTLTGFPTSAVPHVVLDGANHGVYTVTMTSTDEAGNVRTTTQRVRWNNAPQVVLNPVTTTAGRPNVLAPDYLADIDNGFYGDTIVSTVWDFGDGSLGSGLANPTHKYHQNSTGALPGGYQLTYTATDNWGAQTQRSAWVTVTNTLTGSLYEDELWHGSQVVTGTVTVPSGVKLTLASDVQIEFRGNLVAGYAQGLTVSGTLVVEDGAKLSKADGQLRNWAGILVNGSASIGNAEIRDADRGLAVDATGSATLVGTRLQDNDIGVHVVGSTGVVVTGAVIQNNRVYGVKEDAGGRPVVKNSTLGGNFENYYSWDTGALGIGEVNSLGGNSGNLGE